MAAALANFSVSGNQVRTFLFLWRSFIQFLSTALPTDTRASLADRDLQVGDTRVITLLPEAGGFDIVEQCIATSESEQVVPCPPFQQPSSLILPPRRRSLPTPSHFVCCSRTVPRSVAKWNQVTHATLTRLSGALGHATRLSLFLYHAKKKPQKKLHPIC